MFSIAFDDANRRRLLTFRLIESDIDDGERGAADKL